MTLTAKEIEIIITKDFFMKHFGAEITEQNITRSEHPDVHVSFNGKLFGIEVGAAVEQRAITSANQEKRFFELLNQMAINCGIRKDILVRLVMQDDKDTIIHKPAKGFENYRYLPEYVEGIFVFPEATTPAQPISLNQSSSNRTIQDLFPRNKKTIEGIAADITEYVSNLQSSDFVKLGENFPPYHHAVIADMAGYKANSEKFKPFSDNILKKMVGLKDYRESRFDAVFLLLHNFIDQENPGWHDVMHVYWHHCELIIELMRQIVLPEIYDGAYFIDYSRVIGEADVHEIFVGKSFKS